MPRFRFLLYYTIHRLSRTHQLSDSTHRRFYLHGVVVQTFDPFLVLNEFAFQRFHLPAGGIHRLLVLPLRFVAPINVALDGIGRGKSRTPDEGQNIEYSTHYKRFRAGGVQAPSHIARLFFQIVKRKHTGELGLIAQFFLDAQ